MLRGPGRLHQHPPRAPTGLEVDDEGEHGPVTSARHLGRCVDGAPAGREPHGRGTGLEVGVWELTPGIVTDVEVEEVFVVLRGRAILRREDGSETELLPGSVGRLEDGEETEWEVLETLRKIYIA